MFTIIGGYFFSSTLMYGLKHLFPHHEPHHGVGVGVVGDAVHDEAVLMCSFCLSDRGTSNLKFFKPELNTAPG